MLRRFAAATAVASSVAAFAGIVVRLLPAPLERFAPVLSLWCILPAVWGLWAMLAPRAWVPQRLPAWGLILGAVAGALAAFVLNLPSRIAGFPVAIGYRVAGWVMLVLLYYLLWMVVRRAYRALSEA